MWGSDTVGKYWLDALLLFLWDNIVKILAGKHRSKKIIKETGVESEKRAFYSALFLFQCFQRREQEED